MEPRKLARADIDVVRHIEGFPASSDEEIMELSGAPGYTACPNPFIADFIRINGVPYDEESDEYRCEPFAADVSEGKNDPLYAVHTYHTKVPYKAIINYILHYTHPGDIVLDGFCGTGMTGVAAKACGQIDEIEKIRYKKSLGTDVVFGERKAVLSDLSPAATHIAHRYNEGFDIAALAEEGEKLICRLKQECGWMYTTKHSYSTDTPSLFDSPDQFGTINYSVWSDVMVCPHCGAEFVFWDVAVKRAEKKMLDKFHCPDCGAEISKKTAILANEVVYDEKKKTTITIPKLVPVLIRYTTSDGKTWEKDPDAEDYNVIEKIKSTKIPYWYPTTDIPRGDKTQEALNKGITTVDLFFQRRNLYALSLIWNEASPQMKFVISAFILRATKMNKVHMHNFLFGGGGWNAGYLTGVIYFPSLSVETSIIELLNERIKSISRAFASIPNKASAIVSTQSASDLGNIPDNSIDYIFTDPPFGDNLMYSELNFVWESWLKVRTNTTPEAIMNRTQGKQLLFYQEIMTKCFSEYCRVLKPNRWMTIEFHNSKNAVWNAIQEAINRAGLIVADVRTIDKKQGSFNQVTTSSAVKQDLVISVYKPKDSFRRELISKAGHVETAWAFVRQHLSNIPVVVLKAEKIEIVAERQAYLLFDRMVAYHIMNGIPVPLDATDFYKGLDERFLKRDNMYFLSDQVNEYDMARATSDVETVQFSMFVSDEKSAIGWLYQQLDANSGNGPQTYAELMPKFMQELKAVDKREKMPELMTILEENFLKDEEGRWYIPDLTKSGDIAKLREKNLLKEFQQYMESKGKLKVFRSEAIRAGFAMLWKEKNYAAIVAMAERLPDETIQEDSNLLMYYDISLSRV